MALVAVAVALVSNFSPQRGYAARSMSGSPSVEEIRIVAWGASWCPQCVKDKPTLKRLNKTSRYDILFVDFDKHKAFAKRYGIRSIPFYFVVKDGKVQFKTQNLKRLLAYTPKRK